MPNIYTAEWYAAILELANTRQDVTAKAPRGEWRLAVEVVGDGLSPYVPEGETRHWFIRLENGRMVEFREADGPIPGKGLSYRITGPAHVFEGIAGGVVDPVEVGLNGVLTVRGDMRLLMQYADLTSVIFEVYTQNNVTQWPGARPPYK